MPRKAPRHLDRIQARLVEYQRRLAAEAPPPRFLPDLVRDFADAGAALAHIAAHAAEADLRECARALLFAACARGVIPPADARRVAAQAAPRLGDALDSGAVGHEGGVRGEASLSPPDEEKLVLGPLYSLVGGDADEARFRSWFDDLEGSRRSAGVAAALEFGDGVADAQGFFETVAAVRPDRDPLPVALGVGEGLAELNPDAGAMILGGAAAMALERDDPGRARRAVVALAYTGWGRGAWLLRELAHFAPRGGALAGEIAGLVRMHETSRIEPEAPRTGAFSHGQVSVVDGAGTRGIALFFRAPGGGLDALRMLLSDRHGICATACDFGSGAEIDDTLREAAGRVGLADAPVDLELARALVADAWAIHVDRAIPLPWDFLLHRAYLGPAPIEPRRRAPDLGAYALETYVRGPGLARGSEAAVERPCYGGPLFWSDPARAFVADLDLPDVAFGRAAVPERAIDAFAREVVPREMEGFLGRLAANLEVEALRGRERDPFNRAAARLWIALSEGLAPPEELAAIRVLCRRSIEALADDLAREPRSPAGPRTRAGVPP